MTRSLSKKFRFFTFLCIALLVYVHGYNLNQTYLQPYTTINEPMTLTAFIEYFFANGLLRFRIPLLFIISGYLYAMYDHRPYKLQVKNRFRTLFIPFILWSAAGLLLTFILQQWHYTATIVYETHIDQLGDDRPYLEIGWLGVLRRLVWDPVSFQLWFIAVLFFFNVAYPVIKWMVVKAPAIWLTATFIFFFQFSFKLPLLDDRGLFFFSLGVWLQKRNFNLENEPSWFSAGAAWIVFIGLCVIKTFMAFELEPDNAITYWVLLSIYQCALLAGILAVWFGTGNLYKWMMQKKWFSNATAYSFFIFGIHVPLLSYLMKWAMMQTPALPHFRIICYLFVPALVLVICLYAGKLMHRLAPKLYSTFTGGRGF